ncbi:hypothetical protein [Aeromonas caviae]|uniref:Uncharacterized protein n=1 Tax=Aeromonas caviae TaxID=648 RepID=A0AAV4YSU3_AERCA|nr:hypothetical protein [Aeromonas caviae]MEA9437653.1 hypothetical protein [Aeromonas caviae]GJA42867.1 hypothetical protein KAM343_36630 [Aeromonas caviae]GJA79131.1 hypothetical protein KAM354_43670 [Aeromonas caviae]GJA96328.1 hypothetical protein KAM358_41600 [Aeromonas caviae]
MTTYHHQCSRCYCTVTIYEGNQGGDGTVYLDDMLCDACRKRAEEEQHYNDLMLDDDD